MKEGDCADRNMTFIMEAEWHKNTIGNVRPEKFTEGAGNLSVFQRSDEVKSQVKLLSFSLLPYIHLFLPLFE